MTRIYRQSLAYFLASLPALIAFATVIEVALWTLQPKSETSVSFVALTIVAYYFHRHFLFGEALAFRAPKMQPGVPPIKFGWFILISAGLIFVPVGIALVLAFGVADRPSPDVLVLMVLPAYLLALSLFGTSLPAMVARDGSYRVSQGVRVALQTMWRLVLGPGLVGAALAAAAFFAAKGLEPMISGPESLMILALYILIRTTGFLTTILAVAVLCEMYRKTRPEPRMSQGSSPADQTPA